MLANCDPAAFCAAHPTEALSEETLFLSYFPSNSGEIVYILFNSTNGKYIISEEILNEVQGLLYLSESLHFEYKCEPNKSVKRSLSIKKKVYNCNK